MPFRPELMIQAVLAFTTGIVYVYVGRLILRRRLSDDARRANLLFAAWWMGLAGIDALAGMLDVALAFDLRDLPIVVTFVNLLLLVLCAALWGLVYYLTYLYTGSRRAFWPTGAFYGGLGLAFLYLVAWMQPNGMEDTGIGVTLTYARTPPTFLTASMGAALAVPVVAAAFAYGTLFFKVQDRTRRFRIAAVAGSFFLWFGWSLVSSILQLQTRFPGSVRLLVANQLIALAVPVIVTLAYRPPTWLRDRLEAPALVG
jgi:hypothetical protein